MSVPPKYKVIESKQSFYPYHLEVFIIYTIEVNGVPLDTVFPSVEIAYEHILMLEGIDVRVCLTEPTIN